VSTAVSPLNGIIDRVVSTWHIGVMHHQSAILQLASEQGGVIRRDQASGAGFTQDQIDWRVSTGEWKRITNGGYRLIEMLGNLDILRSAATVLPRATVSHFSAAEFHGLWGVPRRTVSVTVPSKTTHTFPGIRVFRNDDLLAEHLSTMRALQVTTLERTIVDLAAAISRRRLEIVLDDLLAQDRCHIADLRVVLDSVARRGKPGVTAMRALLDDRSIDDENRSRLERAGNLLLVAGRFDGYVCEFPMPWAPNRRFDVAFPALRIAIEWDSIRWHTQKQRFQSDRERDRRAIEHGWRVLRFTWRDVTEDPSGTIETIRTVLAIDESV
jgi:very-short-patch-repair endonuclease